MRYALYAAYYIVGCIVGFYSWRGFLRRLDRKYPETPASRMGFDGCFIIFVAYGLAWPLQIICDAITYVPAGWRKRAP